jgi:hypothetical protein
LNTKNLARHYPALSPGERLSLMLAAAARCDEVEHTRLVDAAPRVTYRVPHTLGRAAAFLHVCGLNRMDQLNLAALFFKARALAEATRGRDSTRLRNAARLFAYFAKIHAEDFMLFCEHEQLDPTVCTAPMPGDFVLEHAAREAELEAFTADEAREYAKRDGKPFDDLKTAESVADDLREIYKMWVDQWE